MTDFACEIGCGTRRAILRNGAEIDVIAERGQGGYLIRPKTTYGKDWLRNSAIQLAERVTHPTWGVSGHFRVDWSLSPLDIVKLLPVAQPAHVKEQLRNFQQELDNLRDQSGVATLRNGLKVRVTSGQTGTVWTILPVDHAAEEAVDEAARAINLPPRVMWTDRGRYILSDTCPLDIVSLAPIPAEEPEPAEDVQVDVPEIKLTLTSGVYTLDRLDRLIAKLTEIRNELAN